MLGVEVDVFDVFGADGLEGSEADVEGDGLDLDAVCAELGEDLGREVEAGGGGGGGAGFVGEDGLVAVAVFGGVVAVDVGRQRHVADAVEDSAEVVGGGEAQSAFAELAGGEDFGFEQRCWWSSDAAKCRCSPGWTLRPGRTRAVQSCSASCWVSRTSMRPVGSGELCWVCRPGAGGVEAGGDDAAVVEDQQVAGAEELGQIAKEIVVVFAGGAVEDEHAAGAADGRWGLRDQLFGEIEMEVGYAHSCQF